MQHSVHPAVTQLAGVVAAQPVDGIKRFDDILNKVQGLPPLDSASQHAVNAIRNVGSAQDQSDLFAKVMKSLKRAPKQEQVGYRAVLGALWDDLAFQARRGALTQRQRTLQQDLRNFIYPDTNQASGT